MFPSMQSAHAPPQSTSVSEPFRMLSLQLGGRVAHVPLAQLLVMQSEFAPHDLPLTQGEQSRPPQSTADSTPLRTLSLQVGTAHRKAVQMPLTQSAATPQASPSRQSEQLPPQSTSVSEPFVCESLQLAGGSTQMPLAHEPVAQSGL
jgi:hypothetical protein